MKELILKLTALKGKMELVNDQNKKLVEENLELKMKLQNIENQILKQKSVQNHEKIVKIAELFQAAERKELSSQLGQMIKYIDQCIALIEHDKVEIKE